MTIQEIEKIVCSWKFTDPSSLHNDCRKGIYAYQRQVIWYLFFQPNNEFMTIKEAGEYFGRDHATVWHGINVINDYIDTDKDKRKEIEFLHKVVTAGISRQDVLMFNDRLKRIEDYLSEHDN